MTTEAITPLRQRMIEDMSSRKLCAHTQRGHIYSCKRFAAFLKRSPETATCEDIRLFQLHLAETGGKKIVDLAPAAPLITPLSFCHHRKHREIRSQNRVFQQPARAI
jgi:Phage integrase, N-terminal SAM-like domain